MRRRVLIIGRWLVEFFFAVDGYDIDEVMYALYDAGMRVRTMRRALKIMERCKPNKGFTAANPDEHHIIVLIGPTTSGDEFQDTLVHEIHHVAVIIARSLGIDLSSEAPAYISGDTTRELAKTICELGCRHCRG